MSKKFFINNLDTDFGQALLSQLVKQPTQEPVHMCTVRVPVDKKPNGIKKILKRQKPKLFTKKMIQECEVFVYNITQTEISDIQFGIQAMSKPFEDNKIFILVSDILAWYDSGRKEKKDEPKPPAEGQEGQAVQQKQPQNKDGDEQPKEDEEGNNQNEAENNQREEEEDPKPIQYTYFEDSDYLMRKPLEHHNYIKQIEDKVLDIKKENIKIYVICPGVIYGCGEDALYPLFRAAWLQQPKKLTYLAPGDNLMPMIHLKDLVKFVIKVAENPPQGPPYLLAIDENPDKTHKAAIESISKGIGSGQIVSTMKQTQLFENLDRFCIHLDMKPSKHLIGTPEEPVEFQWTSREGIGKNILKARDEFCQKHNLRPMKIIVIQNEEQWKKQSQLDYILKIFSKYYRIPVLQIRQVMREAAEFGDQELRKDIEEELKNLNSYLQEGVPRKLDETMKVFYRMIKWRLTQNDCKNRGYICLNFPKFSEELEYIFKKLSPKKLKRKKPKEEKKPKEPPAEGEEGENPPEEQKQEGEPQEEAQQEGEQGEGPKMEQFMPESIISIKRAGKESFEQVIQYFTSKGTQQLIYDTTGAQQHQIFESIRNYLERNGRPNNYLEDEQKLLKKHLDFTQKENQKSLAQRQSEKNAKIQAEQKVLEARNKLRDQICQIVRTQGEQQIKKMPFRNYLMEFVVPTLNEGLLEVSNIIPNDPVDLLAQYLYQKSYDF